MNVNKTGGDQNIKEIIPLLETDPCFLYENINRHQELYQKLTNIFKMLSCGKEYNLSGKTTQYIQGTWYDGLLLELDKVTAVVLAKVNKESGFKFAKVYYDTIRETVDKQGNKQFSYNVFIQDANEELNLRIWINVVKFVTEVEKKEEVLTCTKLTLPPFPTFEVGYPQPDQYLPLPTEVITTPGFDRLSDEGIKYRKGLPIKYLYLNSISIYNTNAVINANGKCLDEGKCGDYEIKLDHSIYNGPTTPFVEPACVRNKWPKLPDQPVGDKEWNCNIRAQNWDCNGVLYPSKKEEGCYGTQSSTTPIPDRPEYWPTQVTIPRNSGPNYWLFDLVRGDPSQGAAFSNY